MLPTADTRSRASVQFRITRTVHASSRSIDRNTQAHNLHCPPLRNQMRKISESRSHWQVRRRSPFQRTILLIRNYNSPFFPPKKLEDWGTLWVWQVDQKHCPGWMAARQAKSSLAQSGVSDMQRSEQVGGLKAPITAQPQGMSLRRGKGWVKVKTKQGPGGTQWQA